MNKFNYAKLRGRIRECDFTQAQLAKAIGVSKGTLSAKLNGQFAFTTEEVLSISQELSIPLNEIGAYFFTVRVQNSEYSSR